MMSSAFFDGGYTIIPNLLNSEELIRVRGEVDFYSTLSSTSGMSRIGNDIIPLTWRDPIVSLFLENESALESIGTAISATDIKWVSAYITSKPAHSPPLYWHQDWWCWRHPISFEARAPQVAVLCYLSATDHSTGALRVLPGSHRQILDMHRSIPRPHSDQAENLPSSHVAMMDVPGQNTIALNAGDAVIIDYRLLHGTHANMGSSRRDAILLSFLPDWEVMPIDIQAHIALHPALPSPCEWPTVPFKLRNLLAHYNGTPLSMTIDRMVPSDLAVMPGFAPEPPFAET